MGATYVSMTNLIFYVCISCHLITLPLGLFSTSLSKNILMTLTKNEICYCLTCVDGKSLIVHNSENMFVKYSTNVAPFLSGVFDKSCKVIILKS
jgi:hypothetical protein